MNCPYLAFGRHRASRKYTNIFRGCNKSYHGGAAGLATFGVRPEVSGCFDPQETGKKRRQLVLRSVVATLLRRVAAAALQSTFWASAAADVFCYSLLLTFANYLHLGHCDSASWRTKFTRLGRFYPPPAGKSRGTRSGTRLPRPWLGLRPPWRPRLCRGLATRLAMTNPSVNQLCENQ